MIDESGFPSREDQKRIEDHLYQRALYVVMTQQGDANLTKARLNREFAKVQPGGPEETKFEQVQMEIEQERARKRDEERRKS